MDVRFGENLLSQSISRRAALGVLAAAAAGAATAGCTNTSGAGSTTSSSPAAGATFDIPNSGTAFPKTDVKLRWMDSGDQKAYFFKPYFAAYHRKHPNITVNYDGSNWSQIQQVITLGVRNGSEPDVFQLPGQITIPQAVANHWIGPFDNLVPNWAQVKKRYPPGIFANGITDFSGQTYAIPLVAGRRFNNLLMFNQDYTKRTGTDPSKTMTWDEFRKMLKTATKQGNGKYYGIIMGLSGTTHLSAVASVMAQMAGLHGAETGQHPGSGGIDYKTGEYGFTNPLLTEAIELFLAIHADGSFFPGSTSLDDAGARNRMPQGTAAVIFDGPWDIDLWHSANPSLNLGMNIPPQKDPKTIWPLTYGPGGNGK